MTKKTKKPLKAAKVESRNKVKRKPITAKNLHDQSRVGVALDRLLTLAMTLKSSNELPEVVAIVHRELKGLNADLDNSVIWIMDEPARSAALWFAPAGKKIFTQGVHVNLSDMRYIKQLLDAWKKRKTTWTYELKEKEKQELDQNLFTESDLARLPENIRKALIPDTSVSMSFYNYGGLQVSSPQPFSKEQLNALNRFSKAFDLCYTRLKDLQKAESQEREAQIEASLERIRSRSMAMHKSEELLEVINVVSIELEHLKFKFNTVSFAVNNQEHDYKFWFAVMGSRTPLYIEVPYLKHPMFDRVKDVLAKGTGFYTDTLTQEENRQWHEHVFAHVDFPFLTDETKEYILNSSYARSVAITPSIMLVVSNYAGRPYSAYENDIIRRFAVVFEQSYTRFLDLKRAEAQTREAQIEASLERVRSKSMAMHTSEDVSAATSTMFDEIARLGVGSMRCGIAIFQPNEEMEVWTSTVTDEGRSMKGGGIISINRHPLWQAIYREWARPKEFFFYRLEGEDLKAYYRALTSHKNYSAPYITGELPEHNCYGFHFKDGVVFTFSYENYSEEHINIWKRFASVFSLTYRRYKDLKNAEAQAHEAQIEAGLERVRAKAMAMHSTSDLSATIGTIFIELKNLGIKPLRFGLGIIDQKDQVTGQLFSVAISDKGADLQLLGWIRLEGHPVLQGIQKSWLDKSDYFPVLKGDLLKSYYEKLRPGLPAPEWHADYEQYGQFYPFEEGSLYAWSETPAAPAEVAVFKRFTAVLALTYKRYKEIQQSEANVREALKRASIDRVRAEIASMRTTKDLERITPLIWNELTELGVPFVRCGVFIMDEAAQIIHTFLSTPEGKAIGAFNIPFSTPGNIQYALEYWRKNEIYIDRWTEEVFVQFAETLVAQGAMSSTEQYLSTIPHGGFYLHFLPFLQGMLYVGNTTQIEKDQLNLIQAVADAFSTAYARYEDFINLEAAKEQVDRALADLKLTQSQLVQAEKMASLGELTAGIAHEIQNPLNFVNNFSEVSNELIDEMAEEVNKGNFDEAKAIASDIRKNLEKIHHHGKRADSIVKSMLQHSQSGSRQKQQTDINKLCDEYLRLSYHGLRAKDKSFNAKLDVDFDPLLPQIDVVPQDLGRVLLNMINNAFYAVAERQKINAPDYEGTVSITTKKEGGRIAILIRDNGNGIADTVKGKIFQPFFTTKPTGQGTGLGLSISYDIIKAYDGEIDLETKVGEGSVFTILLPS